MTQQMTLKTRAHRTLRLRPVNDVVKAMRRPIRVLARRRAERIPVRGEVRFQVGDATVSLHSDGRDTIASSIFWRGIDGFEAETLTAVAALARRVETFIDIGANTGIYSVLVATVNPRARVYAFEPVVDIFRALHVNVRENQLSNVVAFCEAVGERVGVIGINVPRSTRIFPTESSLREEFRPDTYTQLTPCTTLERLVSDYGLAEIDLVKIDVEGVEYSVLNGSDRVLSQVRPMFICEVLHGVLDPRLEALLRDKDYVFFHILPSGLHRRDGLIGDETFTFLNYLVVPQEKLPIVRELGLALIE